MGVRSYRGRIVCDKHWPDKTRTIRVCRNRTEAKQLLIRIEAAIVDGTWPELRERLSLRDRGNMTLEEFSVTYIEDYAMARNKKGAWKRKKVSLRALNKVLGKQNLESLIPPVRLHRYVKGRKLQGVTNATVNRDLTTLKHLLPYAVECGIIDTHPAAGFKKLVEEERQRPRFSAEQIQQVLDAIRPECRPLFVFIRETGCRREEALSLQHWQVQEDSELVVFSENTKSKKRRYVGLTEEAIEAVNSLPRLDSCPYVFYSLRFLTRWAVCRKPWENAAKQVGVPDLQVKDLRQHYAQFSPQHSARKILKLLKGGASSKKRSEVETKREHGQRSKRSKG